MSKLVNFFFSFDKLMKESLVRAFYWLALIAIGLCFLREIFDVINIHFLEDVLTLVLFFVQALFAILGLRLAAELAIAIFRINDNLSPDGGKSETADIDPIAEARHAAELAAKRASEATKSAVEKTKGMSSRGEAASKPAGKTDAAPKQAAKPTAKATPKAAVKKEPAKKTAPAKTGTKPAAPKKTSAKKAPVKKATVAAKSTAPRKKAAPKAKPKT